MTEQTTEVVKEPIRPEVVSEAQPNKNYLKIILLVVLGLIILAGAVYAGVTIGRKQGPPEIIPQAVEASPTPSETANWKTYRNEKYGFEFLYRSDLAIKEEQGFILLSYDGELEPYERLFHAQIFIIDNPNNYSPAIYAEKELCKNAVNIPGVGDTKDYCVKLVKDNLKTYKNNKIEGIKTVYNLFENPTFVVIFNYDKKLIQLSSSGETGALPTKMGLQTIDQILSTFKFTNQSQSGETVDWKVYEDPNGVFTLQYPSNFIEQKVDKFYDLDKLLGWKNAGKLSFDEGKSDAADNERNIEINMHIRPKTKNQSLEEWVEKSILTQMERADPSLSTTPAFYKMKPDVKETLNIDGTKAVWLEGSFDPSVRHIYVFIPYIDTQIIFFEIFDGTGGESNRNLQQYEKNKELVKQILSTFKFLE